MHFVPVVLPLLPMAFGLEHVFASYKDCYTWLCRSHMNVRFNLSSMGEGGIGDGHDYMLCSYWGSWHAPSLCLLTNYFALLFPLLFIASALKHVSTAFEAKPGHVAHTWMWDLTCHSWGRVDLEMDMGITLCVHSNFYSCCGSETGGGLWNACWCISLNLGVMKREVMAG